jgi:hypothetical protein
MWKLLAPSVGLGDFLTPVRLAQNEGWDGFGDCSLTLVHRSIDKKGVFSLFFIVNVCGEFMFLSLFDQVFFVRSLGKSFSEKCM